MSRKELKSAILFSIIAFLVLPLLPNKTIDYFGVFNPFSFWLLVVIISALSFTSYLLLKLLSNGLSLSGFLGGFINANVTIYQLLERFKNKSFNGVLLSVASSIISVLLIILFGTLNLNLLAGLFIPLFISTGLVLLLFINRGEQRSNKKLILNNPFNLTNALRIAFLMFLFTQVTYYLSRLIGDSMIYSSIAIASFFSSFITTASIASLYVNGFISDSLAINLVLVTVIVSLLSKLLIIRLAGGKESFKRSLTPFLLWVGLITAYFLCLNSSIL